MIHFSLSRRGLIAVGAAAAAASARAQTKADQEFRYVSGHGGVPLNMVRTGNRNGPQILFLHGFAHSYLAFKRQLQSDLAREFDLVACDHRGHGNSGKPWTAEGYSDSRIWADDVAAIIAAAGNRRPVVAAWSYGTTVLNDYIRHHDIAGLSAVNYIGSLGGLVARGTAPSAGERQSVSREQLLSESPDIEDTIAFAKYAAARYATPNMTAEDHEAHTIMNAMTPPYAQKAIRARDRNRPDVVAKLALPVLVSRGTEDWIISGEETARLVQALPQAAQSVYDATGHMPFVHHPERFNTELAAFARMHWSQAGRPQ